MNLSYTLDGQPAGQYIFNPTLPLSATPQFVSMSVFGMGGLADQEHELVVNVGDDSVFLFDFAKYEQSQADTDATATGSPGSQRTSAPSTTDP